MRLHEFSSLQEEISFQLTVPSNPTDVADIQRALSSFEYDVDPTGTIDDRTVAAITRAQHDIGLPITGRADQATIDAINDAMAEVPGMIAYMAGASTLPLSNKPASINPSNALTSLSTSPRQSPRSAGPNVIMSTPSATVGAKSAPSTAVSKGKSVIIGNEKRIGGTISWRTNNPGNVQYGDFARRHGAIGSAMAGDGEPVAIMPTLDHGWQMQVALWRRPKYNNGTINQGCRNWATGVRDYKGISPYTIALADAAGASVHTKVSELSNEQLKNMVKRQAKLEGFKVGTVTTV